MSVCWTEMDSPVGTLRLSSDGQGLTGLSMTERYRGVVVDAPEERADAVLEEAIAQLRAYFAGELQTFDLPLRPRGSEFQRTVWAELGRVPFGATVSYGQLAQRIGKPSAVRAVARANATNPVGIVVPCHRVIGSDGTLTGYAGGLDRKRWLLTHEGRLSGRVLL